MTGRQLNRLLRGEPNLSPREAQLVGLAKACGARNVGKVAGSVPDSASSDSDVVCAIDTYAADHPDDFGAPLTETLTMNEIIRRSTGRRSGRG